MSVNLYYEDLKRLAREVRAQNGLTSPKVLRRDLRRIYAKYGIGIDLWPYKLRNLRGAFFNDDLGPTVMLAKGLPPDPMVFTMAHELKHFLKDRDLQISYCDQSNENILIERGAEIFASEFLFPDADLISCLEARGILRGQCTASDLVRLKCETKTTLSYAGLAIKTEQLQFASNGSLTGFKGWKKLEEELYGIPFYKKRGKQITSKRSKTKATKTLRRVVRPSENGSG